MLWDSDLLSRETIKFGLSRIDDVDSGPAPHGFLDTQIEDRLALVGVSSNEHNVRCLLDLCDAVGHHPWPAGQRVAWAGKVAVVVIDVRCTVNFAYQLL